MAAQTRSASSRNRGAIICSLSDDLVLHVFSFLQARMLWLMVQLNRRFKRIAGEDILWHALLSAEVGRSNLPSKAIGTPMAAGRSQTWRKRFLQWQRLESCDCEEQEPSLDDGECSPQVRPRSPARPWPATCEPADASPAEGPCSPSRVALPLLSELGIERSSPHALVRQARFLHRAAGLSDRWLYVFGGQGQDGEFNDLWVLDKERAMSGGGWQHVVPQGIAPEQRQSATLTAVSSRLLMFGGRQGETTFMNDTWLFDTATCRWTCVLESDESFMGLQPPLGQRPCPRWAHSAVRFGDRVLVFGGSAPGRCFNDLHWFDLKSLRWQPQLTTSKSPMQRSGHCACAVDDTMFIFGGNTTKNSFNDLWEFDVLSSVWRQIKTTGKSPSGRVGHTITALGARLLVLGGREYATNYFDCHLHSFDVRTHHWSQVPLHTSSPRGGAPPLRTGHCTTVHAGRLLLFGGLRDDGRFLDDITTVELIS